MLNRQVGAGLRTAIPRFGQQREEIKMVKFARCNSLLSLAIDASGKGCRYVAKADLEDDVVKDMAGHITSVHNVDASGMTLNILAATKTTRG